MSERTAVYSRNNNSKSTYLSPAIKAGDFLYISGQLPVTDEGKLLLKGASITEKAIEIFNNIQKILAGANLALNSLVKVNIFLTDIKDIVELNEIYPTFFKYMDPPARSCVAVAQLPKGSNIEIEAIAYSPGSKL